MGDPWKDTIRDMAKWLMKDHPFMFAHIQGQPAIAKAIKVPLFLQDSFYRSKSNADIIHITNATKKDQVFKEREKLRATLRHTTQTAKSIRTMDYVEATNMIKVARRENGWYLPDIGKNDGAVVVIIEADPDYSAEYALALIAWTTMIKRHSTSSARMRLMTMSWEGLHDMTKAIWDYWPTAKEPLREYVLPSMPRNGGRVISDSKNKSATSEMMRWVEKVAPQGIHTCISFRRPARLDESWDRCYQHHQQGLDSAIKPRRTLFINLDFRTAERIPDAGKPHLITSTNRRRLIFDLETRQPITVTTECSKSEEKQQMSWVHRFSGESTNIYTQPGFCYGANKSRRRMRFADDQLGGFLAALSELDNWPLGISNVLRLFDPRGEESQIAIDIRQRLIQQGIFQNDYKSTIGLSLALPKKTHEAFYTILPLVDYDHRLALFLSIKSKNEMINTAKAQLAAMISGSNANCFAFVYKVAPEVHETNDAARIGLLKYVAHTGTVMKGLGFMKTAISATRFSMLLPEIYIIDKQVRVYMDEVKHVMERCRVLLKVLNTCGYSVDETLPFTEEEPEAIEFDVFMEVWAHLLRAYAYQIALVTVEHGEVIIKDLVSQTRIEASFEVQHSFEWEAIPTDKWGYAVGIYTRAVRERGRTVIKDWNWIPPEVWDRWNAELPGGVGGLRTKFKLAKNHDEVYEK